MVVDSRGSTQINSAYLLGTTLDHKMTNVWPLFIALSYILEKGVATTQETYHTTGNG